MKPKDFAQELRDYFAAQGNVRLKLTQTPKPEKKEKKHGR